MAIAIPLFEKSDSTDVKVICVLCPLDQHTDARHHAKEIKP
jgi:hypothetical protein